MHTELLTLTRLKRADALGAPLPLQTFPAPEAVRGRTCCLLSAAGETLVTASTPRVIWRWTQTEDDTIQIIVDYRVGGHWTAGRVVQNGAAAERRAQFERTVCAQIWGEFTWGGPWSPVIVHSSNSSPCSSVTPHRKLFLTSVNVNVWVTEGAIQVQSKVWGVGVRLTEGARGHHGFMKEAGVFAAERLWVQRVEEFTLIQVRGLWKVCSLVCLSNDRLWLLGVCIIPVQRGDVTEQLETRRRNTLFAVSLQKSVSFQN